jgi:DNA-binding HxlR family transcriptional regulator
MQVSEKITEQISAPVSRETTGDVEAQRAPMPPEATENRLSALAEVFGDGAFSASCPTRVVLDHVTSKWGVLVLVALTDRTLRWGELRRTVPGISEKMLAQTLKTFERDGLVAREARPVIPPHVEYSLTPLGDELVTLLHPLLRWITRKTPEILAYTPA